MIISIGELQKNISIIKKAKEPIIVIDKRTGQKIAKITPLKEESDLDLLNRLNSFEKRVDKPYKREELEKAYTEHLKEKYGLS